MRLGRQVLLVGIEVDWNRELAGEVEALSTDSEVVDLLRLRIVAKNCSKPALRYIVSIALGLGRK